MAKATGQRKAPPYVQASAQDASKHSPMRPAVPANPPKAHLSIHKKK